MPIEVTPVGNQDGAFASNSAVTITGFWRQISSQGVTFEHDAAFNTRIVLLTFTLTDEQRLTFVVDVLWTPPTPAPVVHIGAVLLLTDPALALTGRRCVRRVLNEAGFEFEHGEFAAALDHLLAGTRAST